MQRTQIMAARAVRANTPAIRNRVVRNGASPSTRPGTDLLARTTSTPLRTGRKTRAAKLTSTQRNSQGRTSEWARSPYAPRGGWR